MKEVKKEIKSFESVYVATDGTEFKDRAECEKYENSARCVIETKYRNLVVATEIEETIFGVGSADNEVEIVKVRNAEDKDTIMQLYFLVNPHMANHDEDKVKNGWVAQAEEFLDRAIEKGELVLIGRGYDNQSFWFYGTQRSITESFDSIIHDLTTKDDVPQK